MRGICCLGSSACAVGRPTREGTLELTRISIQQTEQADKEYFACQVALQALNDVAQHEHKGIVDFLNPKQRLEFLTTNNQPWNAVITAVANEPSLPQRMQAVWPDALNATRSLYANYIRANPNKWYEQIQAGANPETTDAGELAIGFIYSSLASACSANFLTDGTPADGLRACTSLALMQESKVMRAPKDEYPLVTWCHFHECSGEMATEAQTELVTVMDVTIHNALRNAQMEHLSALYPFMGSPSPR